ncbi:hypothetical protein L1049_005672 [Liquidambar formosana]|uniref:Uncharacterized protein n=1 Tax=Liquidambar formosana TaxID=63359 RepID=A0AAP0N530_LIQFO
MGGSQSTGSSSGTENGEGSSSKGTYEASSVVKVVGAVAGLAAVACSIANVLSAGSEEKTMKAPGRNHRMPRKDFESDPAKYFRDLRK